MDDARESEADDPQDVHDRPPPARRRGPAARALSEPAARFVSRAAATDRRERFERRRREVEDLRRGRRRRTILASMAISGAVACVFGAVGWVVAGSTGVAVALGGVAVVGLASLAVRWAARQRGATAWDWTTQSHRLIGDPSDRVRTRDRHEEDRTGPSRSWWRD